MLTKDQVRELFVYDDGRLLHRYNRASNARAGQEAGYPRDDGRWVLTIDGRYHRRSQVVYVYHHGWYDRSTHEVDHRDVDPSNDRVENLRLATKGQNGANKKRARNNRTGFKGITWHPASQRWHATIGYRGRRYFRSFRCIGQAIRWRRAMAVELHGEFARHH